ncbi:MAG: hypothetical protein ACI9MR_003638, partial [Myxococcota bacterium]
AVLWRPRVILMHRATTRSVMVAFLLLLVTPTAQAGGSLALDVGFHHGASPLGDAALLAPVFEGRLSLGNGSALSLRMGAAWLEAEGESAFVVGNVALGYAFQMGRGAQLIPTVTVPVAAFDDALTPLERLAYQRASAVSALRESWLWSTDSLVIAFPLSRLMPLGPLWSRTVSTLSLQIPVRGDASDVSLVIDTNIRVGYPIKRRFLVGLGLSAVWFITDDFAQFGLEPFVAWVVGPGSELHLTLVTNLDAPFGFAFDSGKVWGLHLGGTWGF